MKLMKGLDGRWSASQMGAMARVVVADGETMREAMDECHKMLILQEAEAKHHEESMSHLADISDPYWSPTAGYYYEEV